MHDVSINIFQMHVQNLYIDEKIRKSFQNSFKSINKLKKQYFFSGRK